MDPNASFGTRYGGYLGSKAGELLGGLAQRAFSSITGFGDYSVNKNVFLGGNLPQIMNESGGGGVVIRFQEYLGDILTSSTPGAFSSLSYKINAADSYTFPYESQIGCNYEQYEIEGLIFQFRSTSADALNSTNTALGSVMMATQYDTLDRPFTSKGEMLNYEFSTSCKPSENCLHMIECAPRMTTVSNLYTLSGVLPSGADPRLYHLGNFQIATTGFQGASVNIGELHVTYQIRLLKPKLYAALGGLIDSFGLQCQAYDDTHPLGTVAALATQSAEYDTMGIVLDSTSITFLRQSVIKYYKCDVWWEGAGGTNVTYPVKTFTNCTVLSELVAPHAGVGIVTKAATTFFIKTDGLNSVPVITFGTAGVLPTGGTHVNVYVNEMNPAVFS